MCRHISNFDISLGCILASLQPASHLAQKINFLGTLLQFLDFLRQRQIRVMQPEFRLHALGDVLDAAHHLQRSFGNRIEDDIAASTDAPFRAVRTNEPEIHSIGLGFADRAAYRLLDFF